jgi:hypothetical protein
MNDRTPSKVEGAIERLNQDPYLLAAITAVPVVGGSITQVLTGIGQQIVQERHTKLLEQLSEHLAAVDEQAINRNYFETPEGFDLLIKAMDESRRTRSDEKRNLIAKILAGAASTESEQGGYSPEDYLNIVAALTPRELEVARTIYSLQRYDRQPDPGKLLEGWEKHRDTIAQEHGLDADSELPLLLDRITSTGLIRMVYEIYAGGGTVPTYWVTPTFGKLMTFLQLRT